ncbi:MAG: hypothetical protein E7359_02370 [Clostridiales bacterium]|nr:hypothetical protein [Clostridiales bacterium]
MKTKSKNNKRLSVLIVTIVFILIIGTIFLAINFFAENYSLKNEFTENVVISGINVKGLNKTEAENLIGGVLKDKIENLNIKLYYKDKMWNYNGKSLEANSNIHTIIDDAFKYSKLNESESESIKNITRQGFNFDIAFNYVFPTFKDKINEIKKEIEFEEINSEVEFLPNTKEIFKITKSKNGVKIDENKLYLDIERQFKNSNNIEIEIPTLLIAPSKNEDYYNDKLSLLGEFSTDLSTSKGGRKHNVSLALEKFNGKILSAHESVSFNDITGPQTEESGYKSAIIIVNGEFVEGVGGGICQASTTLYNALLLSGAQIDEVHKHTLPVGYVELSLDAMVNEGTADLRFTNISDYPIYIQSYVKGDRAYVKIYGKPLEDNVTYNRSVEFVRTIPHNGDKIIVDKSGKYKDKVTYKGEYFRLSFPKEGYEAKAYLEKYKNNELISKELIRHEIYEPKMGLLIEGNETPIEEVENDIKIIPPQIEVETSVDSNKMHSMEQSA